MIGWTKGCGTVHNLCPLACNGFIPFPLQTLGKRQRQSTEDAKGILWPQRCLRETAKKVRLALLGIRKHARNLMNRSLQNALKENGDERDLRMYVLRPARHDAIHVRNRRLFGPCQRI